MGVVVGITTSGSVVEVGVVVGVMFSVSVPDPAEQLAEAALAAEGRRRAF